MSLTNAKKGLIAAAISIAALSGVSSAEAAVYTGRWDPAYGGIFPDLGWTASATFDVPTSCLAQADGPYKIGGTCAGFTVLSAEVDFYNTAVNPDPLTSPVVESFALNTNVIINGIDIAGGQLTGIDTGFFDYFVPSGGALSIAGNGAYSFSLLLFGGNQAQLVYANPTTTSPGCVAFPVDGALCGSSAEAAIGVFTPAVPEPGTYALMAAGLAAIGFVARRRRR